MSDEEIKDWMRENMDGCEDAAQLAEYYCDQNDALDDDGQVPDDINALATEVWDAANKVETTDDEDSE